VLSNSERMQRLRQAGVSEDHDCWACRMGATPEVLDLWYYQRGFEIYERLVEAAESMDSFTQSELWRKVKGGPAEYNMARKVIKDLELHGLIRIIEKKGNVRRWKPLPLGGSNASDHTSHLL